jgi:hypothetical protein
MLSNFSAFLGVVSSHVPANVIPTLIDIFDRVMILANLDIVCALARVGVVSPDGLSFDFAREVVCSSVQERNLFVVLWEC